MTLTDQIADELGQIASALGALLGPDMAIDLERRIAQLAPVLAAQLTQDIDDRLAAQTVIDLMAVLGDRPAAWYGQTPLGRIVARSTGHTFSESVSYSAAAAMLGVSRTRIQQLLAAGTLDRHPEGGVSTASIIARAGG